MELVSKQFCVSIIHMEKLSLEKLISLKGKTALVTGGAMGIGLGITNRLAEAEANIIIADLNEKAGKEAAEKINKDGHKAIFIKTDVSIESDAVAAVDFAKDQYGSLNILVNNAGIYPQVPMMKMERDLFEKIINVNLKSVFLFTKAAAKIMIEQEKGGKIINITSIDALHPSAIGLAAYDASKHGLWGFTKNTALELAPYNIQVNAIAPGGIATPGTGAGQKVPPEMEKIIQEFLKKIPMKRMGKPDEIGKVALFLASELSSYMTGSQIVVDGGALLS